jgi:hypothetical protein
VDRVSPMRVRYAVIEVCDLAAQAERFVLPYRSEKSLRETIAACRIISTGFSSATEAGETLKSRSLGERLLEIARKCRAELQQSCTDQAHRWARIWRWQPASS